MTHERFEELHLHLVSITIWKIQNLFYQRSGGMVNTRQIDKYLQVHVQNEPHIQQICNGTDRKRIFIGSCFPNTSSTRLRLLCSMAVFLDKNETNTILYKDRMIFCNNKINCPKQSQLIQVTGSPSLLLNPHTNQQQKTTPCPKKEK